MLSPATTGADLVALLSEEEVSCISEAVGETFFRILLSTPILAAASSASSGAFFFNCLTVDSVVAFGVAFFDVQAGGWSPETRACANELAKSHPESVYIRLGLAPPEEGVTGFAETHHFNLEIYDCLTNQEKMDFTLSAWRGIDRGVQATGSDVVALLSESEVACVREGLSEEELLAIAGASPLDAVAMGSSVSDCIEHETNISIAVAGFQWGIGPVSEESASCLADFFRENTPYLELLQSGLKDVSSMSPDEFVEITDSGVDQYDCLTSEELMQVSDAFTRALTQ